MAKYRMVNTRFWDDSYITELDPVEKLLFLYLLTNPLTNISGVYELPAKRVAFDTGIDRDMVEKIFRRFEEDGKLLWDHGWLAIRNFLKHQSLNTNVRKGASVELRKAPADLLKRLPIDFESLGIRFEPVCLNPNSNFNFNEKNRTEENSSFPQKTVDSKKPKDQTAYERVCKIVKAIRVEK